MRHTKSCGNVVRVLDIEAVVPDLLRPEEPSHGPRERIPGTCERVFTVRGC